MQTGVADPLKLNLHEAADAIIRVANANMADAVRLISISRGYDPRDFALVAFGGPARSTAPRSARDLSIPAVIVPPHPGITSAMGCLLVDVQHDLSTSYLKPASEADPTELEAAFAVLEGDAAERLAHENVAPDAIVMQRTVDMMYQGQWRSLAVSAPSPITSMGDLIDAFHREHEREYNFRRDGRACWSLPPELEGGRRCAESGAWRGARRRARTSVRIRIARSGSRESAARKHRSTGGPTFPPGVVLNGPAIIEQLDSTTVVPPGFAATVDPWLNIILRLEA